MTTPDPLAEFGRRVIQIMSADYPDTQDESMRERLADIAYTASELRLAVVKDDEEDCDLTLTWLEEINDEPRDTGDNGPQGDSPTYREAMKDAGRGHLLG